MMTSDQVSIVPSVQVAMMPSVQVAIGPSVPPAMMPSVQVAVMSWVQKGEKDEKNEKKTTDKKRGRSGSPSMPYFWPEYENDLKERKKGWYRVDFGPNRVTQMWYLPTVTDRLNFLNRHKDSNPHEPFQTPSPFPVEDDKQRSSAYWKMQRNKFPGTTREVRQSKPLINVGSVPIPKPMTRRSLSIAPNPYKQVPRPGFVPSIGYEPTRSLSQPPTGADNYPERVASYISGYPPMGPPPPRMVPRMAPAYPSYYDYDYGYGGGYGYPSYGYGYAPPPPPPRMSRYDTYLDDEMPEPAYTPRFRSRVPETLEDMDMRDKLNTTSTTTTTTTTPRITPSYLRGKSPPGMLQDHVDKMRIRLKSLAFSLDPSGPVPDIIVPERPKKGGDDKKYTQAVEFSELPKLASRRQRYYPEDEYIKDNLRIKCLSHYKTTRTAADSSMPHFAVVSDTSSRYDKLAGAKWEEPDTVFGTPSSDKKPFSKPLTDGTAEESEDKKERRRKKKSREREVSETLALEASGEASTTPVPPSDLSTSEADKEVEKEASVGDEEALDEKERKKLEKKKRKAEREAAAKAAMEAELAALAAAEAELARLEAESSSLKTDSPAPPAATPAPEPSSTPVPAEPASEVKSESAADKSE
ncbi:hypothetical protein SK128_019831 [Halocaridina rubra]|uniref:Uncharacterized protein n=1 Tax=Halocaridina rubra TaxID=373956 RepID=A0AAN9A683_HALRR